MCDQNGKLPVGKIANLILSARINALYNELNEIPKDLHCFYNNKNTILDLTDFMLKKILVIEEQFDRELICDPELLTNFHDFMQNGKLTQEEHSYLININKLQSPIGYPRKVDLALSIWKKLVRYRLLQPGSNYIKAIVTLSLAGLWKFPDSTLINDTRDDRGFDEVKIARALKFKFNLQEMAQSQEFIRNKNIKFINFLLVKRVNPRLNLGCYGPNQHSHNMLFNQMVILLFNDSIPALVLKKHLITTAPLTAQDNLPQLVAYKLHCLNNSLIQLRKLLNQYSNILINNYLRAVISPQLAKHCQQVKLNISRQEALRIEKKFIKQIKQKFLNKSSNFSKLERKLIASQHLPFYNKQLAATDFRRQLLKAIQP